MVMKKFLFLALLPLLITCTSNQTEKHLNAKMEKLGFSKEFNEILGYCQDQKERDAISFLYAYMPLGDICDYDPQLYIDGVRCSFLAQKEMSWGGKVPNDIFNHFVLPLRVNNENIDSARIVFYNELKDRVKDLSMYDAVLEVNHWCHEKVSYTPSDVRTSAPLASVKTAYGRCGEESTFTVTALRSVGIPARQVYTPRWAHTDDNHAWVEAWVDGKWYYLGACEPEAKLNVGWFSSTALRALLMHNKVFGYYKGEEDIIQRTDCFTEINVTSNYAPTEKVNVTVVDESGKAVQGAKVEFKIYNYAEFYSAITAVSDKNGKTSAIFGKGDILVWASKGDKFGFEKVTAGMNPIIITLDKTIGETIMVEEMDLVPPVEREVEVVLTQDEINGNKERLAQEDSIRNAYISTFVTSASDKEVEKIMVSSRGNWKEILTYISSLSSKNHDYGMRLLNLISEKDLRDTPAYVLLDHINNYGIGDDNSFYGSDDSVYISYVLNPRISNELLSAWRGYFQKNPETSVLKENPHAIIAFTKKIKICNELNTQNITITPKGVMKFKAADENSRNIFFVALCRSMNVPARIEEVSGKVQYYQSGIWIDVDFEGGGVVKTALKGYLHLLYRGDGPIDDPKFETNFTVAKIENGSINTLNFRDKEGMEGSMSWKNTFDRAIELDCGYYMLTSGTRIEGGTVLSRVSFFKIEESKTSEVELVLRKKSDEMKVIGKINSETIKQIDHLFELKGISEQWQTKGLFLLGFLNANHEPSNHVIRIIFGKKWNIPVLLMFKSQAELEKYQNDTFPQAPDKVIVTIAPAGMIQHIINNLELKKENMPLIILGDKEGHIFYISQGYSTSLNLASGLTQ